MSETTERLRELLAAATGVGEWYWTPYGKGARTLAKPGPLLGGAFGESRGHEHNILKTTEDWPPTEADAALIAAAVNALPELLAKAEAHDALVVAVEGLTAEWARTARSGLPTDTQFRRGYDSALRNCVAGATAALRAATEDAATSEESK